MYPEDIQTLFALVQAGTNVTVVNQPVKLGWAAGELYIEIHPERADAEALETRGVPRSIISANADDRVVKAAGNAAGRLDWYAIHLAESASEAGSRRGSRCRPRACEASRSGVEILKRQGETAKSNDAGSPDDT